MCSRRRSRRRPSGCSGNTEPGLAEGTLAQAQQRVDNYAAGFFRAGAGAVIADAYLAPEYYVRSVLRGARSIDSIWKNAPNRNDHFLRFPSQRTTGAIAQMDPDQINSGFHRSIVLKARLTSAQVVDNAVLPPEVAIIPVEPSLIGLGVTFGAPDLTTPPIAGAKTRLTLPIAKDAAALLPAELMVGTRWDRLDGGTAGTAGASVSPSPAAAPTPTPTPRATPVPKPAASEAPTGSQSPAGSQAPDASQAPAVTPAPTASPPPVPDAPPIDLVVPEQAGEVVAPVLARRLASGGVSVPVTVPSTPGLYRLVATVHRPDGVAYDASTQALLPALVVRVTGPLTATYGAPATATAAATAPFQMKVRVTNLGRNAWGRPAATHVVGAAELEPARRATLVARWVDLGGLGATSAPGPLLATTILPAGLAPGASVNVAVQLIAPTVPGEYLLVLDVVDPTTGSLAADGVPPGIVRITVTG